MEHKRSVGKPPPEMQCTATSKRSGKRCENWKSKGKSVCHIHGGKTQPGFSHPSFIHGRYSKSIPARLAQRYEEALTDARRVELSDELALVISRNQQLLNSLYSGEADGLWLRLRTLKREMQAAERDGRQDDVAETFAALLRVIEAGAADAERWVELLRNVEQQRRLAESERKRRVEDQQVATVEELMSLMGGILSIITRYVKDERTRRAIGTDLDALVGGAQPMGAISGN